MGRYIIQCVQATEVDLEQSPQSGNNCFHPSHNQVPRLETLNFLTRLEQYVGDIGGRIQKLAGDPQRREAKYDKGKEEHFEL